MILDVTILKYYPTAAGAAAGDFVMHFAGWSKVESLEAGILDKVGQLAAFSAIFTLSICTRRQSNHNII